MVFCWFTSSLRYLQASIDVLSSVLLGELRADITNWWYKLVGQQSSTPGASGDQPKSSLPEMTYIRLLMSGQELTPDMDKKTLQALEFRAEQV